MDEMNMRLDQVENKADIIKDSMDDDNPYFLEKLENKVSDMENERAFAKATMNINDWGSYVDQENRPKITPKPSINERTSFVPKGGNKGGFRTTEFVGADNLDVDEDGFYQAGKYRFKYKYDGRNETDSKVIDIEKKMNAMESKVEQVNT